MTSPPPQPPLPTKVKFLADLEIIKACDICHEPFDGTHKATRTKCHHIFGLVCLTKWINTNAEQCNTCPKCRRALFVKPAHTPVFVSGPRPDYPSHFSLDMFIDPVFARVVVLFMWNAMRKLHVHGVIYDSDIEAQMHKVGYYIVQDSPVLFRIAPTHLVHLREIAKDMIREQVETAHVGLMDPEFAGRLGHVWLPRVAEVLGWPVEKLVIGEVPEEHEVEFSRWFQMDILGVLFLPRQPR